MQANKSKLLIIAGAGKGIGLACVKETLECYPDYTVLAISRNTAQLSKLKQSFPLLKVLQVDLSKLSLENKSELNNIISEHYLIGIVFSAGILKKVPFGKIDQILFESLYINNIWSFIDLIQTVLPFINNSTHIVSLGSMGGYTGTLKFPGMLIYSSSKAALSNVTECMAEELKDTGASINCLVLGAVSTEMLKEAFPDFETSISPGMISKFIINFTLFQKQLFNGKVIPVSSTIP